MLILVSALAAFWPVWRWYTLRMSDGSDEPFGIAALVAGLLLLVANRADLRLTRAGALAAAGTSAVYLAGFGILPPLVRALLALATLAFLSGTLRRHPAIWGLFALSLPVVASLQFYLGLPMRLATASSSVTILEVFGIEVQRQGTDFLWDGQAIGVDPACSGVRMLWAGLFLVMMLCAARRVTWSGTMLATASGVLLVLAGNAVRASALFVKEAGLVSLPDWTHEGLGLLVFAGLVWGMGRLMPAVGPGRFEATPTVAETGVPRVAILGSAALLALAPALPSVSSSPPSTAEFPGWPETWHEAPLEPLPLSTREARFAEDFPGKIGVFQCGERRLILRWVARPTRKLHSSADCLRAIGFEIENERPGLFMASSAQGDWLVRESIREDLHSSSHRQWREVSAWFWSASLGRSHGPWWAITEIRPAPLVDG